MEGYYKYIELENYGGKLKLKERSFRNLQRFEILVRIICTTVHSADLLFLKGEYGDSKPDIFPVTPGFEGSGEIVKVGEDIDKKYVGQKVAVYADSNHLGSFDGLWSQYHYTTLPNIIVFTQDIQFETICNIIDPLTALGMYDTSIKEKSQAVVQTDATSNVSKIFYKLCYNESIQTINIVNDDKEYLELRNLQESNILKITDSDWEGELEKLCNQLKAQICFDSVGGDMTGKILTLLPNGSKLYHYGNLQDQELYKLQSTDFIFKDKTLCGWWVMNWIKSLSQTEINFYWSLIQKTFQYYSNVFDLKTREEFTLLDIAKAIDYKNHLREGVAIIKLFITN